MTLTSTRFFVTVLVALLLAMLLLGTSWNKVSGPTPVRFLSRLGMLLLSQFLAVVAVLTYVNNSMGPFYETWGDLFDDGSRPAVAAAASGVASGDHAGTLKFTAYKGRVQMADVTGPRSQVQAKLFVWLPPQYDEPAYAHTRFPVVELLPGTPGMPQTWFGTMDAVAPLTRLMAEGKAKPMILVAAKLNVLGENTDAGCADIPGTALTATWLSRDVPDLVRANFRTQSGARHWAVMGYSAGAYCAVNLAVQHPEVFHAAASLSGYNAPESPLVTRDPALTRANNPYDVLRAAKRQPDVSLLLGGSEDDGETLPDAKALLGVLREPQGSQLLTVGSGSHTTSLWRSMLPAAFTWLSRQVS